MGTARRPLEQHLRCPLPEEGTAALAGSPVWPGLEEGGSKARAARAGGEEGAGSAVADSGAIAPLCRTRFRPGRAMGARLLLAAALLLLRTPAAGGDGERLGGHMAVRLAPSRPPRPFGTSCDPSKPPRGARGAEGHPGVSGGGLCGSPVLPAPPRHRAPSPARGEGRRLEPALGSQDRCRIRPRAVLTRGPLPPPPPPQRR